MENEIHQTRENQYSRLSISTEERFITSFASHLKLFPNNKELDIDCFDDSLWRNVSVFFLITYIYIVRIDVITK